MELEFHTWLRQRLPPSPWLHLGPGDDAAVLAPAAGSRYVTTVDLLADGAHFRLDEAGPRRVGYKSLAVNLSDLAAMASSPLAALVAFCLPRENSGRLAVELVEGMLPLAERFGVAIAGGDTNCWDGSLVVSVTAIGAAPEKGVWRRDGARADDRLLVTGGFGGSLLGGHLDFTPRVDEARVIHDRYDVHAAIDVSDGLALDVARIAEASGCGAEIDTRCVPVTPAARKAAASGPRTPLEHALGDGEDFELALAVPPGDAERLLQEQPIGVPLTDIGQFSGDPGLWQIDAEGRRPLDAIGFRH